MRSLKFTLDSKTSVFLHRPLATFTHYNVHDLRPDGRLQLFINKGGVYTHDKIFWKVSEEPGDVTEFGPLQESTEVGVPQGRQPYPLVDKKSGDIYVVLNARSDERYTSLWRSMDGGDTFEEFHRMFTLAPDLSGNRSYTRAYMEGNDIHMIAVRVGWAENLDGYSIGRSEGVFYIRYNVNERAFYRADGTQAFDLDEAPIDDKDYLDTLWHWQEDGDGEHRALWADIVAKEGRPYAAFAVQNAAPQGHSMPHYGYWAVPDDDGRWQSSRVAKLARGWDNTPERINYSIAIHPEQPENIFVAKSTSWEQDSSQVHHMRTPDDGKNWEQVQVLSREGRVTTVVVPWQNDLKTPRVFDVLWMEGRHEGWGNYETRILTHEKK